MKRIFTILQQTAKNILTFAILAGAMASCDSILDYDEGDCSIEYRVKFKYDYNMKKVDAFAQEVKTITLYAFDENGTLAYQKTEEGERLASGEYTMSVDMNPGNYELITWAGVDDQSFAVPLLTPGTSKREALNVLTRRTAASMRASTEEGKYVVQQNLSPLFHGRVESVTLEAKPNTRAIQQVVTTVPLVKNTNTIRVAIAQVKQNAEQPGITRALDENRFSYAIYDDNGFMNYDNTLLADDLLTYLPFVTESSSITTRAFSNKNTDYPAIIAEISMPRLLVSQSPQLEIIDKETGKQLLPANSLISYIALLKQQGFIDMPLQEYLDREDHFGMIFFVDENFTLLKSVIQINDWIVQINDIEL